MAMAYFKILPRTLLEELRKIPQRHGREGMHSRCWLENLRREVCLGDLHMNWRVILEWILEKWNGNIVEQMHLDWDREQ